MKKVKVILNVQISDSEDLKAVLNSYFSSHSSARKIEFVDSCEEQEKLPILEGEIEEEVSETAPEKTIQEKAKDLVESKTNPQLKSFKAKYKIETENDKNETLKPAIVAFLVENLDATFE